MLRQQGCLLVHVTSSFLVLGLKGGFTQRPCRIRTLDLHRIYSSVQLSLGKIGNIVSPFAGFCRHCQIVAREDSENGENLRPDPNARSVLLASCGVAATPTN